MVLGVSTVDVMEGGFSPHDVSVSFNNSFAEAVGASLWTSAISQCSSDVQLPYLPLPEASPRMENLTCSHA